MAGSRKEFEMLFRLSAQLGGSYNSTFSKAQSKLHDMQKEISALNKTQADISSYQKQQKAVEATRSKLNVLQQQYDNIQREISETGGFSSELENRLLSQQEKINRAKEALERQTEALNRTREALNKAGVDTDNLGEESEELKKKLESLRNEQEKVAEEAEKMGNSASQSIVSYQEALAASGIYEKLEEIFDQLNECAEASIEFESALTGVDKTTNMTAEELDQLATAVKNLSLDIPVTTDEMLAIGEVAGQLGIAKENILDFSTTMSMLSTATTMTAEDAATMLAQFANITQMNPKEYDRLASTIVALGNNYATTEQKITDMSQGIAASGSLAGMTEADMLGISAAVSSLGIEAQMGSTSISKLISILMTAVETGDGLKELARVAGMTSDQFVTAWQTNAAGALESFVVGLSETDRLGQSAIVTLTDLGITETRMQRTILSLSNSGDLLTRTITTANTAWEENVALTNEAEKRYATTASQQILLQNAVNNLHIAIGDTFNPELKKLYSLASDIVSGATEFVEQNPALVKALVATIAVIGGVTTAMLAYAAAAKVAKAATTMLTSAIPGAKTIMLVTAAVGALAGVVTYLSEKIEWGTDATKTLTVASQKEYEEVQKLRGEYEKACETYGETSEEALLLAWQVDKLSESFEANKQTIEEYIEECDAASTAAMETLDANREASRQLEINQGTTLALVHRLQDLAAATDLSSAEQAEMDAIIAELNKALPQLAANYDAASGSVQDFAYAAEAVIMEEADMERAAQYRKQMVDAYNAVYEAKQRIEKIEAPGGELETAQTNYYAEKFLYGSIGAEDEKKILDDLTQELADLYAVVEQGESDYETARDNLAQFAQEHAEAVAPINEINDVIERTYAEVEALATAYTEAYNAAYQSVSGQYTLWEDAAEVVATSTGTINSAIDSQITYWQNYNSNLQSLTERSKDIEGLSDMIASFADGSTESVNAVAGMATATDEELAAMVTDWQTLQAEQDKVATSIAELNTNFTAEMDALKTQLASDIEEMNLSEEAAASGKYTILGFIEGAEDMIPEVVAAYSAIANSAISAIDKTLNINSPSKEMEWRAEMTWAGYIGKTKAMEPELTAAMSEAANAGAEATAIDLQMFAFAPQLIAAMNAFRGAGVVEASSGERNTSTSIQITFQISGDATPDVVEALDLYGAEFAERVCEIVQEAKMDTERMSY